METYTLTKQQAADLFGGSQADLARGLGVTRQAIQQWTDPLTVRQTDSIIGAALRLGLITSRRDLEKRIAA